MVDNYFPVTRSTWFSEIKVGFLLRGNEESDAKRVKRHITISTEISRLTFKCPLQILSKILRVTNKFIYGIHSLSSPRMMVLSELQEAMMGSFGWKVISLTDPLCPGR